MDCHYRSLQGRRPGFVRSGMFRPCGSVRAMSGSVRAMTRIGTLRSTKFGRMANVSFQVHTCKACRLVARDGGTRRVVLDSVSTPRRCHDRLGFGLSGRSNPPHSCSSSHGYAFGGPGGLCNVHRWRIASSVPQIHAKPVVCNITLDLQRSSSSIPYEDGHTNASEPSQWTRLLKEVRHHFRPFISNARALIKAPFS